MAVATVLALIHGGTAPVHAAALETGGIAGTFTKNGAAVADATVSAIPVSGSHYGYATTSETGEFSIADLPVGEYKVSFASPGGGHQYFAGKTHHEYGDRVVVTAGAVTTINEQQLGFGRVEGTFRDRNGQPLSGAYVTFEPVSGGYGMSSPTDSLGAFGHSLWAGRYRVKLEVNPFSIGSFAQWSPGVRDREQAQIYEISDGQTFTLNETLMPTGRLSGRFTDAAGNGLANIFVMASPEGMLGGTARTGPDGSWVVPYLVTGQQFKVQFTDWANGISQYAYGTVHSEQATLFSVSDGQELVVNDSLLPTGSLKVTAKDAATGAAVTSFGVSLGQAGYGETQTGEVIIPSVPVGTHPLSSYALGFENAESTVTVTAGQQTSIEISLRSKAKIEATVVDAATGQPISGVCLVAAKPTHFFLPDGCHGVSDAQGKAVAETSEAGWFQLFAFPYEAAGGYGAQWVTANGGSGSQLAAKLIKVEEGKGSQGPVVKLDRAGTVTGTVRNVAAEPLPWAEIAVGPWSAETGGGIGVTSTDENGSYTISYLGPYQWPLMFSHLNLREYSGAVGNRHLAQTVSVQTGQTTTYDFQFRAPVAVTVDVNGNVTGDCYLYVVNAVTGDRMGGGWAENCTTDPITFQAVGPQAIKVYVYYQSGDEYILRWHGGGSFLTAKPVLLPATGSKSFTFPL